MTLPTVIDRAKKQPDKIATLKNILSGCTSIINKNMEVKNDNYCKVNVGTGSHI